MKCKKINEIKSIFPAISENESLARTISAAFVSKASPTISQLADVKCAVSEAVTNCVVHAYPNGDGMIEMRLCLFEGGIASITVKDRGIGIPDVTEARKPLFTTDITGERSGMGFAIMESLMDSIKVNSKVGKGTTVTLKIKLGIT